MEDPSKCVALAMGQHPRLGALSRVADLDPGVLKMILEQHELGIKEERQEVEELKKKTVELKLLLWEKCTTSYRTVKFIFHEILRDEPAVLRAMVRGRSFPALPPPLCRTPPSDGLTSPLLDAGRSWRRSASQPPARPWSMRESSPLSKRSPICER